MKKSPETVEDWERKGGKSPTYVQLETLAYEIYNRPVAIFFFPDPPREIDPKSSFRTLPASELEDLPPTFLKLFRDAQAMQINLEELTDGVNPYPNKIFRDLSFSPRDNAQRIGAVVRRYLGVSLETQLQWKEAGTALREWRRTIQDNGIYVFKETFRTDEISGFCIYDREFPVIYLNNSMPLTGQIFTLFHELVHLLLKTGGIDKTNDGFPRKLKGDNRRAEALCKTFAGAFLVPDSDFETMLKQTKLDDEGIRQLAGRYNVSREVILRKCLDRKLFDRAHYEPKLKQWTEELRRRNKQVIGGDYYHKVVVYLGEAYLDLVFKKYHEGRFDEFRLADYLGVKVTSVPGVESEFLSRT